MHQGVYLGLYITLYVKKKMDSLFLYETNYIAAAS